MVPVVGASERGRWPLAGPLAPMMKPGGHGAIWKLMADGGVFAWLASLRRRAALVRQIRRADISSISAFTTVFIISSMLLFGLPCFILFRFVCFRLFRFTLSCHVFCIFLLFVISVPFSQVTMLHFVLPQ